LPDLPFLGHDEEAVREATTRDLGALADEVVRPTDAVELSTDKQAEALLEKALALRDRAEGAFERAESPNDFADVAAAIGRARYVLACAQARFDGTSTPAILQPCFFDPATAPPSDSSPGPLQSAIRGRSRLAPPMPS
jgi:hypothetical protein